MVGRHENGAPRRGSKRLLAELSGRIRALEGGSLGSKKRSEGGAPPVPSGLVALWALERGVLHEFCGVGGSDRDWAPPIALFVHLARRGLRGAGAAASVLWVGRRLWPYPGALLGDAELVGGDGGAIRLVERDGDARGDLLARSLFVDPGPRALVWAADRALRCAGSAVVAIDGRGLDIGTTRRLQLAAEASGALALVARPADDARRPSVAAGRWLVERAVATDGAPSFRLTPLKRRAAHPRTVSHTDPSIDGHEVPHDDEAVGRNERTPHFSCGTFRPSIDGSVCDTVRG